MGLIKAAAGALGGTLADQWKEFFYCDSLSKDVLVTRGQKQISGRSSNTKGHDNVISNGSGIAVASSASAALGAISEDGSLFGKSIIFVAMAEGIALYGLIISFMILGSL